MHKIKATLVFCYVLFFGLNCEKKSYARCLKVMITNTAGSRLNVREEPRRQSTTIAKVSEGAVYEFRGGKKGDQVQDDVNPKLISDAWKSQLTQRHRVQVAL
ncbi:MAG: hypothetical protein KBD78_03850 [Oligoflexales bacterium]|nr:hypothetical protein [Oligoflexales bacterium]